MATIFKPLDSKRPITAPIKRRSTQSGFSRISERCMDMKFSISGWTGIREICKYVRPDCGVPMRNREVPFARFRWSMHGSENQRMIVHLVALLRDRIASEASPQKRMPEKASQRPPNTFLASSVKTATIRPYDIPRSDIAKRHCQFSDLGRYRGQTVRAG